MWNQRKELLHDEFQLNFLLVVFFQLFVLADKMMRTIAIEWQTYNTFGEKLNEKKQNVQTANRRIIATSSELSLMQVFFFK
jgi:hypothetical protein